MLFCQKFQSILKPFNAHAHQLKNNEIAVVQLNATDAIPVGVTFSVGIHPKDATNWNRQLKDDLAKRAAQTACKAIGEIGLDNRYPPVMQEQVFVEQLKIAATLNKPVLLHCVNEWYKCKALHYLHAPNSFLIYHGFTKPKLINEVLAYEKSILSIGAQVFTNEQLKKVVATIPINRLLIETDDSECDLFSIYHEIAQLKSIPLPTLIAEIATNATQIFEL